LNVNITGIFIYGICHVFLHMIYKLVK